MAVITDEMIARLVEAGLYDPSGEDAEQKLELIAHLQERGATIQQMAAADRDGRLLAVAADLAMFDFGVPMTIEEVASAADVPVERVMRVRLARGLPAEPGASLPAWAPEDVAGFDLGAAFFGEGPILAFSRVMGASAARIGEAAVSLFLKEVEAGLDASGASLLERAVANESASDLVNVVTTLMDHLVREHLELAVRRQRQSASGWARTEAEMAIGFVDLAGSTEWATRITLREQADALALFESAAWDIATSRGGRVVKLIGDEAMFAATDPGQACRIALELCEAVDAEPLLPRARGAVGFGAVIIRDGDYFGPLVHVTARAVKQAGEGAVVVTEGVRGQRRGERAGLRFDSIGAHELRGIETPVALYQVTAEEAV